MPYTTELKIIKSIQFRTESRGPDGKVIYGWNKRFQMPSAAARHWVDHRMNDWEDKKFGSPIGNGQYSRGYHKMTAADKARGLRLQKRLLKFVTWKLKELMK